MPSENPRFLSPQHRVNGDLSLYFFIVKQGVPLDPESIDVHDEGRRYTQRVGLQDHPTVDGVRFFQGRSVKNWFASGMEITYKHAGQDRLTERIVDVEFTWHTGQGQMVRDLTLDYGVDVQLPSEETDPGSYEQVLSIIDALHRQDPGRFPTFRSVHDFITKAGMTNEDPYKD